MEELEKKVRTEERLKIKIGEAKNLQCRPHGSASQRDVYCAVALDQEEIFRTTTMEKTLCPFFGEEFQFEVPRPFRYLSIYVYDRDRHLKQDKVLGKVAIKREDLNSYHNKDHWFPIRPVDADSEVQGKANIELKYEPVLNKNMSLTSHFLSIKVIECFDLTLKNRCCDSYAAVTVTYSNGRKQTKRTKVKKKTTCPRFDEVFVFESSDYKSDNRGSDSVSGAGYVVSPVGEADAYEVNVALWHDTGMGGEDLFLGEVRIPLRSNTQQIRSANAWYYLQPRKSKERGAMRKASCSTPPGSRLSTDNSLGSLRLQVHYIADYIFPTKSYDRLRNLLLQSIQMQPITSSAVYVLGEIVSSKMEAAQPVVRVFMHHGQIIPIIRLLATYEISKLTDPTTIFRGNTLVSKMMDETMRLSGLHYLHKTLRPAMDLIFNEKKPCEIDPTRVKDPATIEINLSNLIEYVNKVFEAITQSAVYCPSLMCQIFHNLKECAMIYFPQNKEVQYSVISGFIFLRFFAPAILGPRLFDLTTEQIDSQTNRTLTLISKTIQSLGNLVSARNTCIDEAANNSVLVHPSCKEEYMERVHKAVATPAHIQAIRQFLEIISASSRNPGERGGPIDTPVLLKEGVMIKRAQGRNRFGRKNFKQRYFRLTTHDLTYSKNKGKDPLCTIPLSDILAVERLTEESFKKKNMFQVVQRERALYVQAGNCVEQKEWVDLLTKLCGNAGRLESYHPGAYINQHWLCCKTSGEHSTGCTQVSKCSSDFDWSGLPRTCTIDEERELERIHSLVVSHMQRLDVLLAQMCECTAAAENKDTATSTEGCISVRRDMKSSDTSSLVKNYDIDVCFMPAEWVVEDVHSCLKTLSQLRDVTCALENEHRIYLRALARETKYGSKQAPIGDDNYLHLAARMNFDQPIPRKCLDT